MLTIGFALLLSFMVVFASRQYSNELAATYPTVDCTEYYSNYEGDSLMNFAIQEYDAQEAKKEAGLSAVYNGGYLTCFCLQKSGEGAANDATYPDANG